MARIRTIKPSFWGDDKIVPLSRDARLLAAGLISFADDEGRFIATANAVLGFVFPHDELPDRLFHKWMSEIEGTKFAYRYKVDGRTYGYIPNFRKHQRISHPQASTLPDPPLEGLWN